MKRLLASALFVAATSVPAYAQDVWNGPYIGADVGYSSGTSRTDFSNGAPTLGTDPSGAVYGGLLGYDFRMDDIVLGVEGGLEGANVTGSASSTAGITSTARTTQDHLQGSVRGKIGFVFDPAMFWGDTMIYATGGAEFGHFRLQGGPFPPPPCCGREKSKTGWSVGAGLDHVICDGTSLRFEYLYSDYGAMIEPLPPTFPGVLIRTHPNSFSTIRLAVVFHPGWW
jgi:outer membrane immunogenic protein